MTKDKYSGEHNVNARINIDYAGKKPVVSFGYPIPLKHKPYRGSMFSTIFMFWLLIFCFLWIGYSYSNSMTEAIYGKDNVQKYVECAVTEPYQSLVNYSNVRYYICKDYLDESFLYRTPLIFLLIFLLLIIPPYLIYLPFKKKWDKLYPKWQGFLAFKKYRKFKKEDIKEDENGIYIELPVFNNVVCDFKATQDFSKYIKQFEIREYKFYYLKKKKIKIGKKKKKIKKYNEFIWYARWYFKQKPVKGCLEVIFK